MVKLAQLRGRSLPACGSGEGMAAEGGAEG